MVPVAVLAMPSATPCAKRTASRMATESARKYSPVVATNMTMPASRTLRRLTTSTSWPITSRPARAPTMKIPATSPASLGEAPYLRMA